MPSRVSVPLANCDWWNWSQKKAVGTAYPGWRLEDGWGGRVRRYWVLTGRLHRWLRATLQGGSKMAAIAGWGCTGVSWTLTGSQSQTRVADRRRGEGKGGGGRGDGKREEREQTKRADSSRSPYSRRLIVSRKYSDRRIPLIMCPTARSTDSPSWRFLVSSFPSMLRLSFSLYLALLCSSIRLASPFSEPRRGSPLCMRLVFAIKRGAQGRVFLRTLLVVQGSTFGWGSTDGDRQWVSGCLGDSIGWESVFADQFNRKMCPIIELSYVSFTISRNICSTHDLLKSVHSINLQQLEQSNRMETLLTDRSID